MLPEVGVGGRKVFDAALRNSIKIVCAYVSRNPVSPVQLREVLASTYEMLCQISVGSARAVEAPEAATPREIRTSIQAEGLISFIDGRSYKTLKRHLTAHGLTPQDYRAKYGLPRDYPMVAPGYAAKRSEIARSLQLRHRTG
ncbi:MucR family transcriptional regulator [Methylobacterium oryzae CBMB20]|uniref:MucR family transcriptional regulator n=1 Tax=Methylobacterium oryzae TaxID=334852 RepID=A0ABU7TQ33_9HYPH